MMIHNRHFKNTGFKMNRIRAANLESDLMFEKLLIASATSVIERTIQMHTTRVESWQFLNHKINNK